MIYKISTSKHSNNQTFKHSKAYIQMYIYIQIKHLNVQTQTFLTNYQ